LPPRGTITSIVSVIVSISPTATRSRVGTSWIEASGSPAAFRPSTRHSWISVEEWKLSEPPRRIAALLACLQAKRAGICSHVRTAFEDHPDDSQRRAHSFDMQARGTVPFRNDGADGVRLTRNRAQAIHDALNAVFVQHQPVKHRRRKALFRAEFHVLVIGRNDLGPPVPDGIRRSHQRGLLCLCAGICQFRRRCFGLLADLCHCRFDIHYASHCHIVPMHQRGASGISQN
jgi:hypothetical protein